MINKRLEKFEIGLLEYLRQFDNEKYDLQVYFDAINSHQLISTKLRDILCWKLAGKRKYAQLSKKHQSLIKRAIEKVHDINLFKKSQMSLEDFQDTLKYISPNGPVIQLFICHICNPEKFPLFDRHVYRAFQYFKTGRIQQGSLNKKIIDSYYDSYSRFFNSLHARYRRLYSRKEIDSALMVFGKELSQRKNS